MKRCDALCLLNSVPKSILALLLVVLISGCGSGSSSGGPSETLSFGTSTKNVQLTAGVQKQFKFTYAFPGDITSRGDYSINVTKTLENITLSSTPIASKGSRFETLRLLAYALVKEAFAAETAQITTYISYAGDPNVCNSPYFSGPNTVMGAVGSAPTSNKTTAELTQAAADIINMGSFDICVVTTPPFNAYVTVPGVVVDFQSCAPPTINIVGNWSGTYQCDNFGTPGEAGTVSLNITQNADGSYHYVDDGGAEYDGHLCGNKFKFKGVKTGFYTESGTLVVNGNHATKTSNWRSESTSVGGRCTDTLQKNS